MKKILFAILTMTFLGINAVNAQDYPPQLTPHQDSVARAVFADTTLPSFDSIPPNSVFDYEEECLPIFLPLNRNKPPVLFEICVEETGTTITSRVRIVDISETSFLLLGSMGTYLSPIKSAQNFYNGHCHVELDEGFYNSEELTGRWISLNRGVRITGRVLRNGLPCPSLAKSLADKISDYVLRRTKQ